MAKPADFFIDPMRMELALGVLTLWFAAFGYDGKATGSLNATLRNIANWAKVLVRMRDSESNITFGRMVCSYTSQQQLPKGTFCLAPYAFENHGRAQKQLVHHPQDRALGRRWRAGTAP